MGDQDYLLRTANSATALGNRISMNMVEFLNKVKDQPAGFRDLGLDFLSICQILNSLEGSLQEYFKKQQPFPQKAIPELVKVLEKTLDDFTQLKYLLQKFMQYEMGGTFATLQKTWRMIFADKDIAKVRGSLQANKGALTMTMLLININPNPSAAPVGYEYGMLAAKLEHQNSMPQVMPQLHSSAPPPYPPPGFVPFQESTHSQYQYPAPEQFQYAPSYQSSNYAVVATTAGTVSSGSVGLLTPSMSEMSFSETAPENPPIVDSQVNEKRMDSATVQEDPVMDRGQPNILMQEPIIQTYPENQKLLGLHVDRSKLPRRIPQSKTGANSNALQKTLVTVVAAQKHQIVEQLLDRGVSPNTGPEKVALIEATSNKDLTSMKLLLEFGADPDAKDSNGNTALVSACKKNHEAEAKLLLEYGADPNLPGPGLSIEAALRNPGCLELLISAGADLIARKGIMETAVYVNSIGAVRVLLDAGLDPNEKNDIHTPVTTSIRDNHPEILALLLSRGADPYLKGQDEPLKMAANKPQLLQQLLIGGVDTSKCEGVLETAVYQNSLECVTMFLDAGADPNEKNEGVYTPLGTAVRDNHPEISRVLLARGANPNLKGQDFPLAMAVTRPLILKQLLAAGADVKQCKGIMESAVYRNNIDCVEILLDAGLPPNGEPDDYYRPLHTAVRDNHPETLALLLSRGADPNLKGENFPLALAANRPQILKQLLASGADVKVCKGLVETAVYRNNIESVQILLDAGLPVNGDTDDYYRPLHTAVRDNHPEILSLLLSKRADPNLKGESIPVKLAANKPVLLKQLIAAGANPRACKEILEYAVYLNCLDSIPILLEAGIPVDGEETDHYRPLTTAIRDNHPKILTYLLSRGANPNKASGDGLPIVQAARFGDPERLRILLDGGADLNIQHNGRSALMQACEHNAAENVKLLMQRGVDVNAVDSRGSSAMDIAAHKGHDELVMMLLEAM